MKKMSALNAARVFHAAAKKKCHKSYPSYQGQRRKIKKVALPPYMTAKALKEANAGTKKRGFRYDEVEIGLAGAVKASSTDEDELTVKRETTVYVLHLLCLPRPRAKRKEMSTLQTRSAFHHQCHH